MTSDMFNISDFLNLKLHSESKNDDDNVTTTTTTNHISNSHINTPNNTTDQIEKNNPIDISKINANDERHNQNGKQKSQSSKRVDRQQNVKKVDVNRKTTRKVSTSASKSSLDTNIDGILTHLLRDDTYSGIAPHTRMKTIHTLNDTLYRQLVTITTTIDNTSSSSQQQHNQNHPSKTPHVIISDITRLIYDHHSMLLHDDSSTVSGGVLRSLIYRLREMKSERECKRTDNDNYHHTQDAMEQEEEEKDFYELCRLLASRYATEVEFYIYRDSDRQFPLYRSKVIQILSALEYNGMTLIEIYLPHELVVLDDDTLSQKTSLYQEKQDYLDTARTGEVMLNHILHHFGSGKRNDAHTDNTNNNAPQNNTGNRMNRCRNCKKEGTIQVTQKQTRGADEGMTFYYECTHCGNRYKIN